MRALLVTLAMLLLPGVSQAQAIALVSNIREQHDGVVEARAVFRSKRREGEKLWTARKKA